MFIFRVINAARKVPEVVVPRQISNDGPCYILGHKSFLK